MKIQDANITLSNITFENYAFKSGSASPFYAEKSYNNIFTVFNFSNFKLINITVLMDNYAFFIHLNSSFQLINFISVLARNITSLAIGSGFIGIFGESNLAYFDNFINENNIIYSFFFF